MYAAGALYLAGIAAAASVRVRRPVSALLAPLVFVLQQIAYGAGSLAGILAPARSPRFGASKTRTSDVPLPRSLTKGIT